LSLESRLRPFVNKVLASIADQATSSTANFVMNVLLARWLAPAEYGSFSVSWSFCLVSPLSQRDYSRTHDPSSVPPNMGRA